MKLGLALSDVRFGSKANIGTSTSNVRFTPESGHYNRLDVAPEARHTAKQGTSGTQKIAGSNHGTPGELGLVRKLASTPKALRQSPIIVRLGTDSVNPSRQQISKFLVSVAQKPQ